MYLKSIEVQGFKSFANKIVFDFHNGITGIVGPNGSGKSNVADAVRWVLGEQRAKQLRGGNMQDVIFSGTENRKPLSYAMVAITLDNSDHQLPVDYNEVTVARKLYRSGESEYLLNGSQCRLKDINEMFYDTGIGKEGYSIIGQGQIDKILSGKPEDRRELFDEAVGIVKYKRRKNVSLKKLEEEQANLVRVNDILAELEKQFGPLQRQSEKARQYLVKKDELKRYDINMFLMEVTRLKALLQEIEENLEIVQNDLRESSAKHEAMKEVYEQLDDEIETIEFEIEEAKTQQSNAQILRKSLENEIALLKEQINSVRSNDEHYTVRSKAIREELESRQKALLELDGEQKQIAEGLAKKLEEQKACYQMLDNIRMEREGVSRELDEKRQSIRNLLENRATISARIQKFHSEDEASRTQIAQINREIVESDTVLVQLEEQTATYEKQADEISERIQQYLDETDAFEAEIKTLQGEVDRLNAKLQKEQSEYHRERSRLESLRNMTERYDGYGNSIRKVMEQKEKNAGIMGVVADLIKVEKRYEIAIETALGGSIQNIVTSDEETAKRMIQFLKVNKFGRATFLPLTAIRGGRSEQANLLKESGVIGFADSLVSCEARYQKLAENLLGRTLVVDHIDTGIRLSRKFHQSLRIVTLDGELMNPGGSMSGGAFKNSSNLLSRRREVEELESVVAQAKARLEETEASLDQVKKRRAGLYGKLDETQNLLRNAYVTQNTATMNLKQSRMQRASIEAGRRSVLERKRELEAEQKKILQELAAIEGEQQGSKQIEEDLNTEIESLGILLEEKRQEEEEGVKHNEDIRLAFAALEQKGSFAEENSSRIREEIEKFEDELSILEANKDSNIGEISAKEEKIQSLQEAIDDSEELFDEIKSSIEDLQKRKEELNKKHRQAINERENLSTRLAELGKEELRLTTRKENYEDALEKQYNYMWEEYELTFGRATELKDETLTDVSFLKKMIAQIKGEIKALGPVNVNAIEDFKELAARYEFMKTQHDDLVEAEGTLLKIVEELDSAMRKQFQEQFALIQTEFNKVFRQLFGGGKGTLELVEDEDVLEAGIRIIAQPPGKKLQNMMQLSGGEKALTAISLLFAIQNLKPSPFCLLDEIEAALDDSNVTRFAEYLHKLTENTQFIVITHRRGTMTAADRLYGITMQEKGISTLVSVDLIADDVIN